MPRDRATVRELALEAVFFLPDVIALFRRVLRDYELPRRTKIETGLALAYVLSPLDFAPDAIPVIGQIDDVAVVAWATRRLVQAIGEDTLRKEWRGSDRGLKVILALVESGLRPRKLARKLAREHLLAERRGGRRE